MAKSGKFLLLKDLLTITLICMIGATGIIFAVLYLDTFSSGFIFDYSLFLRITSVSIISVITVLNLIFLRNRTGVLYKLALITNVLIAIILLGLYLLTTSGFMDKIDSVEDFRAFISSYGGSAVFLFILLQFLQVVVLPIPAFITVGAGVLLFGPFYGGLYSCIGIILGSIVAYFLGRIFGVKVVRWLIGQDSLDKGMKLIKGKDKIILTFMLIFPFFPDDVLCFIAGLTTINPLYFTVSITFIRIVTVYISSYSFNNSIIPYDTWWGIILWVIFFIVTVLLALWVYKKGDKIESKIKSFFSKKNKSN